MKRRLQILPAIFLLGLIRNLIAGQVPHLAETPDIPLGSHDRVYTADQTSNTVSVYDPSGNRLVGVLRLGDVTPQNLSPLYRGQLVPTGEGLDHLEPLAEAGLSAHLLMGTPGASAREAPTTVTLNNQGLIDLLQAAVTGLKPKTTYLLALVEDREDPNADFQPLSRFNTNPSGAAIVNTLGPLRHVVVGPSGQNERRYLVIFPAEVGGRPKPVQIQLE